MCGLGYIHSKMDVCAALQDTAPPPSPPSSLSRHALIADLLHAYRLPCTLQVRYFAIVCSTCCYGSRTIRLWLRYHDHYRKAVPWLLPVSEYTTTAAVAVAQTKASRSPFVIVVTVFFVTIVAVAAAATPPSPPPPTLPPTQLVPLMFVVLMTAVLFLVWGSCLGGW